MKKFMKHFSIKTSIYVILLAFLLTALPADARQADTDKELARTQEFIAATTQKGTAKINALKAYVKKFPETTSRWTRLAYYNLAIESFQTKKYADAAKYGEQTLKIGSLDAGEEARLLLVVANCYGIKSAPIFNQAKALEYANKAVSFAQAKDQKDVLAQAKTLKSKLSGPPPKKISPEQQIKMHYSDMDYSAAIAFYQKLGAADKGNPEIQKTYCNALFKARKFDTALPEYKKYYESSKNAQAALRIADIYSKKARKNKSMLDQAVNYYLEASVRYQKEGNSSNQKIAQQKASYNLFEKYGFNQKVKALEAQQKKSAGAAQKNKSEIRKLKLQLRKHKRRLRTEYEMNDLAAPPFEQDETRRLEKKIRALESGATPQTSDAGEKLQQERDRINKELQDLLAAVKKKLG